MRIRFLGLAAALCLGALALTGCGSGNESPSGSAPASSSPQPTPTATPAPLTGLVLGHSQRDGYNPYLVSSSLVVQNAGLLFEKLVEIGPDMALSYRLASSIDCVGTEAVLHIRPGCFFADGAPITAEDAAASLLAAKQSDMYAGRLANLADIRVQGDAVLVTLYRPDSLLAYLCDVPVLKAAEAATANQPTPSGRYTYGANNTLVTNSRSPFGNEGPEEITLVEVSSYDEMVSGFSIGKLNLYGASETADTAPSFSSKQTAYRTNHLIYLGINAQSQLEAASPNPLLATAEGRALVSRLIDRRQLAEKSYYSRAYPATGAINSFYPCVQSQQKILAESELDAASARTSFEALGYSRDGVSGYYQNAEGQRLTIRLLVYGGSTYKKYAANLLQQQLASKGLYLELVEENDFDTFAEKVAQGDFELYIGEVKLYNNMDMSPFFEGGSASVGIVPSEALTLSYAQFKENQSAAGAFEAAFAAEMPYVPLLWRNGFVVHHQQVSGLSASLSNTFYSLKELAFGQAGNS